MTIKTELFKRLYPSVTEHYRQILSYYFTYMKHKNWNALSVLGNVDEIKQELHDYTPFFKEIFGINITADEPQEGLHELTGWVTEYEENASNQSPIGVS